MNPTLPSKFGTIVERLDINKVMADAFEMASELPRRRRLGNRVRSSEIKAKFEGLARMRVFAVHGCKCDRCGLEGTEILRTMDNGGAIRVDLFAVKEGRYVLMNRDHILPASKKGPNHLWNLRPMCEPCNSKRGNTFTDDDRKMYEFRLRWARWGRRLFQWTPLLTDRAIYVLSTILARISK